MPSDRVSVHMDDRDVRALPARDLVDVRGPRDPRGRPARRLGRAVRGHALQHAVLQLRQRALGHPELAVEPGVEPIGTPAVHQPRRGQHGSAAPRAGIDDRRDLGQPRGSQAPRLIEARGEGPAEPVGVLVPAHPGLDQLEPGGDPRDLHGESAREPGQPPFVGEAKRSAPSGGRLDFRFSADRGEHRAEQPFAVHEVEHEGAAPQDLLELVRLEQEGLNALRLDAVVPVFSHGSLPVCRGLAPRPTPSGSVTLAESLVRRPRPSGCAGETPRLV